MVRGKGKQNHAHSSWDPLTTNTVLATKTIQPDHKNKRTEQTARSQSQPAGVKLFVSFQAAQSRYHTQKGRVRPKGRQPPSCFPPLDLVIPQKRGGPKGPATQKHGAPVRAAETHFTTLGQTTARTIVQRKQTLGLHSHASRANYRIASRL